MSSTPKSSLRYPASTAAPNVPQDLQNLATDLDWTGGNFSTTSARDAANPTPATGDQCRILGQAQVYYSSAWHYLQDDSNAVGPWVNLTAATNFTFYALGQARQCGSWIELRGTLRHASWFPTSIVMGCTISSGTSPLSNLNAGNSSNGYVTVPGMAGLGTPTGESVTLNARTDGGIRVTASAASTVQVISLEGVRFASA